MNADCYTISALLVALLQSCRNPAEPHEPPFSFELLFDRMGHVMGVGCAVLCMQRKNEKQKVAIFAIYIHYEGYIYIFFERPDDFLFAFVDVFLQLLTKIYVLPLGRCCSGFVVFVLFI